MKSICFYVTLSLSILSTTQLCAAETERENFPVVQNYEKVLRVDSTAHEIIIGNNDIAEATIADGKTVVISGKNPGTTNLVVLNEHGDIIAERRIEVLAEFGNHNISPLLDDNFINDPVPNSGWILLTSVE